VVAGGGSVTKFASETSVSVERSLEEIKQTIRRYEGSKFAYFEDDARIAIEFSAYQRRVRFVVPLPKRDDTAFRYTTGGRHGKAGSFNENGYQQALRQRYRALLLCIKAKLESVETGIETFDEAFMSQLVLPNGKTVGETALPQIVIAYETGTVPPLLAAGDLS
jgi:hypothetical protein